jgi:hypothetical protein
MFFPYIFFYYTKLLFVNRFLTVFSGMPLAMIGLGEYPFMNNDYILTGKGQITLHQPDWARFTPARAETIGTDADFGKTLDGVNASKSVTKAATAKTKPTDIDEARAQPITRFNTFDHSGYGKSVGPGVDTVDFGFDDFLDIINPLQHIPIVNMIYREVTGDKISGVSKVAGSALFFGPLGIVSAAIDAAVNQEKGADMGETMIAGLLGRDPPASLKNKSLSTPQGDTSGVTMLADATHTNSKQPFGGIMGTDTAHAEIAPETVPVAHVPTEAEGKKMFSLAGVAHHVGSPARMPIMTSDDVRFKSYGKPSAPNIVKAAEQNTHLPDVQNIKPISQIEYPENLPSPGLSAPGFMPSASAYPPSAATGGNPIPAQLIQDMMMLNMQKYQDGLKNGNLPNGHRGSSVDIEG